MSEKTKRDYLQEAFPDAKIKEKVDLETLSIHIDRELSRKEIEFLMAYGMQTIKRSGKGMTVKF